jgi:hypothetical protein
MWFLPHLNTTHAFVSQGWGPRPMTHAVDISCSITEFERHHPNISMYFISHPLPLSSISDPAVSFDENKLQCKVNSLDRATICKDVPERWFWDNLHVLSIMNEEFNHKLIESICPIT